MFRYIDFGKELTVGVSSRDLLNFPKSTFDSRHHVITTVICCVFGPHANISMSFCLYRLCSVGTKYKLGKFISLPVTVMPNEVRTHETLGIVSLTNAKSIAVIISV